MSDIIRLLPDSVANQIAAGEVIQRPSSVIKELVENAVDAGATEIRIFVKDAGRTLIQVVDNGKGMSETDARMAFERHATSKISKADDLFTLSTMGFRGEALPSICAISHVEVRTCAQDAGVGTCLIINGSKVESQSPVMCDKGTSISVKNLFFNVPARRKFLKSDNVELSNVMREFERLALVNNKIHMSIDTGTRSLDLRPGTFKQRIGELWKGNLDMSLLPVEIDTAIVKISGFISRPEAARRRNPLQYLIVNGRNMRHLYFHKAILGCYDSLIAADTQPCYFLKFEVDPASIDVNISPTKNEIKFENESEIRPLLVAAVRASLGKNAAVPSIDFDSNPVEVQPLNPGESPVIPTSDINPNYNPFDVGTPKSPGESYFNHHQSGSNSANLRNWDSLYSDFMSRAHKSFADSDNNPNDKDILPDLMAQQAENVGCLQFALKYIVTTTREGVLIIDQHRAHVKVLYEDIMSHVSQEQPASQHILFPELLTLDGTMQAAFNEIEPELKRLGFLLTPQGEGSWSINAIPAIRHGMARNLGAKEIILRILGSVTEDSTNYGKDGTSDAKDSLISRVALLMARASAIERGRKLQQSEMENLVADLFRLSDPTYTPNGNLIYTLLDQQRLSSIFK